MTRRNVLVLLWVLLPALLTACILSIAGNPSDGIRLGLLSLSGAWLIYRAISRTRLGWKVAAICWWLVFLGDASLRSLSWFVYQSDTDAYFIVQAIANTTAQEALEFLQLHAQTLLLASLAFSIGFIGYFWICFKPTFRNLSAHVFQVRLNRYLCSFLGVLALASYLIEPSRAQHPMLYWTDYYSKIQNFKQQIETHQQLHDVWLETAKHKLVLDNQQPQSQTHTLLITDSVTSKNFGVCGYPRNTTPELEKYSSSFKIFCQAFSPAASTIGALKMKLTEARHVEQSQYATESVLAYAKTAGFKVYWISNQNDSYISSLFGSFVDEQIYTNHRSGRSSHSFDEKLLPVYQEILTRPEPKKLIIVHMLGAHPNYQLRYPQQFDRFSSENTDAVESQLEQNDIGMLVQQQRNYYDNSILYQDWLIGRFFQILQKNDHAQRRSFIFVSDHGNEVGHEIDFAGHSPNTQASYQVPLVVWHNGIKDTGVNLNSPINTADVDQMMMELMGLHERNPHTHDSLLSHNYLFHPSSNWPYWKATASS